MDDQKKCKCPEIEDQDWHLKDLDWSGKFFYFEDLPHFFNVPLGLEKKQEEMKAQIVRKGYSIVNEDMILHEPGLFRGRLLLEIEDPEQYDANVLQFENARILTRVHHGGSGGLKESLDELKAFTQDRTHVLPGAIYYWHVTCPKCAKERGGDKTVLLARV